MDFYRPQLISKNFIDSVQLKELEAGKRVRIAGLIIRPHRPPTRSGKVVVFLTMEDEFDLIEVTVFEHIYHRYAKMLLIIRY